jgi:hypothetical protein
LNVSDILLRIIKPLCNSWESGPTIVRELKEFLVILKPGVFQLAMKAILYPTKCLQHEALARFNRLTTSGATSTPHQPMVHYLLELIAISDRIVAFGYTGHGKVIPSALGKMMWFGLAAQAGLMPCLNPNIIRIGGTPENLLEIVPAAWPMDAARRNPLQSSDRCQILTFGAPFASVSTLSHIWMSWHSTRHVCSIPNTHVH